MATLSILPHLEAIKRLSTYCWTKKQISTRRAAGIATLSMLPHLEAIKRLLTFFKEEALPHRLHSSAGL
jgi:hypothetical protein